MWNYNTAAVLSWNSWVRQLFPNIILNISCNIWTLALGRNRVNCFRGWSPFGRAAAAAENPPWRPHTRDAVADNMPGAQHPHRERSRDKERVVFEQKARWRQARRWGTGILIMSSSGTTVYHTRPRAGVRGSGETFQLHYFTRKMHR